MGDGATSLSAASTTVTPEPVRETALDREHAEFHNAYQLENTRNAVRFLRAIYGDSMHFSPDDVNAGFVSGLKTLGKKLYFFVQGLTDHVTPSSYIKHKFSFLQGSVPGGDPHLFYLAWNGLARNDSFKRLLHQKFSLRRFNDLIVARNIPAYGARNTRYRLKLVIAADDVRKVDPSGQVRTQGRALDDGTGRVLREGLVWLPNGKGMPLFPDAYVPINQTHVIGSRHGKSAHESGGSDPEFVGSGKWDIWKDNRRLSGAITAPGPRTPESRLGPLISGARARAPISPCRQRPGAGLSLANTRWPGARACAPRRQRG